MEYKSDIKSFRTQIIIFSLLLISTICMSIYVNRLMAGLIFLIIFFNLYLMYKNYKRRYVLNEDKLMIKQGDKTLEIPFSNMKKILVSDQFPFPSTTITYSTSGEIAFHKLLENEKFIKEILKINPNIIVE